MIDIVSNYKLYGLSNTINKFKFKNYGYDVIKRILIDNNIFGNYKYSGRQKDIIPIHITKKITTLRRKGFTIREIIKELKTKNVVVSFAKTRKVVNSINMKKSYQIDKNYTY
jgi:hypothetical protein